MFDAVKYTQKLIRLDPTNPPGREAECGELVANTLEAVGFQVERQSFGVSRMNVVATLQGSDANLAPLVLTGHLDTVPLGKTEWTYPAFGGEIHDDRLYGRGASDMKSGVAAMIGAALQFVERSNRSPRRGLTLVLSRQI